MPIVEGVGVRQIVSADVARNIYLDGEWLRPKLNMLPHPRLMLSEFPLYCGLVSIAHSISGISIEVAGRLLTVLAFMGTSYLLFLLVLKYFGVNVAIASLFFWGTSPLGIIYGKGVQPDVLMVFMSVFSLYLWILWLEKQKLNYFLFAVSAIAITPVIKSTGLSILLPLLFLSYEKYNKKMFSNIWIIVMVIASILPIMLWTKYGVTLQTSITPYYSDTVSFEAWFSIKQLISFQYYKKIFEMIIGVVLTPVGFSLLLLGLAVKLENRKELFWYVWLLSTLAQFILMNKRFGLHWFLLSLPVFSVFMGRGLVFLIDSFSQGKTYFSFKFAKLIGLIVYMAMVFGYGNSAYLIPSGVKDVVEIGQALKNISTKDDIIVSDLGRYGIYYSGRIGYPMAYGKSRLSLMLNEIKEHTTEPGYSSIKPDPISLLEYYKKRGAKYFSCSKCFEDKVPKKFYDYITSTYKVVKEKNGIYKIFDLSTDKKQL